MKLYLYNVVRFLFLSLIAVVIASVSSDSLIADTDEDLVALLKGWEITVSPALFRYDDEITVAISGLSKDFPFDTNSVRLGGVKLHVPNPGDGPRGRLFSDDDGEFVFRTVVPDGLSPGVHYLRVNMRGNFIARTPVELLPVTLRVSSSVIVPFQEVWVVGMGYTKATGNEGKNFTTIKAMNMKTYRSAGVTIGGQMVHQPHIEYPVKLGPDGSVFFRMIIPELESTTTPGEVQLRVRDSEGREGVVAVTVPAAELKLDSYVSYPGEHVSFSVTGLPVPRENTNDYVEVVYGYAMDTSGTKHVSKLLGSFTPDQTGSIFGRFNIPEAALLSSSNKVWVTASNGMRWDFDHYLAAQSISIEPNSGLQGDPIQVTIKGMPRNYPLKVGSVSLEGNRIKVPGHLGESGSSPVSNHVGFLTFASSIPTATVPGDRSLAWTPPGKGTVSTTFRVVEGDLNFVPSSVVPGQEVTMTSELRSREAQGVEISGNDSSYVYIDNVKRFHEVIDYPIPLSPDRGFETTFKVPVSRDIVGKDSVDVTARDTAGRVSRGVLRLKKRSVTVTPRESIRGTTVSVEGTGFFANAKEVDSPYRATVYYNGTRIGSEALDTNGTFKRSFNVPAFADVATENQVMVKLEGWPSLTVYSSHRVPKSEASVVPDSAFPGEIVLVSGTGFTPFRQVTIGIGHLWPNVVGPAVHTGQMGEFEVLVEVPSDIPEGKVDLKVYAHYPVEVANVPFDIR